MLANEEYLGDANLMGADILDCVRSYLVQDGGTQKRLEKETTLKKGLCDHGKFAFQVLKEWVA